jgi:glutathione synthase/RimK-type ligase-like ATP-grasp enzyme
VVSNICCDKSATSAILSANKIACFEHIYFTKDFYTEKELLATFHSNKNNVVIKPNTGTSGIDVYHCTKQDDFLKKSMHIIKHYPGLAISPFYNYNIEYRVVVNNGKIILSLCKEKSHIIGDGINNVESLSKQKNINPTTILGVDKNYLPAQHEKVYIN